MIKQFMIACLEKKRENLKLINIKQICTKRVISDDIDKSKTAPRNLYIPAESNLPATNYAFIHARGVVAISHRAQDK